MRNRAAWAGSIGRHQAPRASGAEARRRDAPCWPLLSGERRPTPDPAEDHPMPDALPPRTPASVPPVFLTLRVNGRDHALALDPRTTLLDALREHLGLTGTKVGCNHGTCGACTVHLDGRRQLSCLVLAAAAQGREVRTIEGLADADGALHPMQAAFVAHDAMQCGYCTPGQIMSAVSCVEEGHARSDEEIREYMSGNLCRCGAYPNIVAAVREVAGARQRQVA